MKPGGTLPGSTEIISSPWYNKFHFFAGRLLPGYVRVYASGESYTEMDRKSGRVMDGEAAGHLLGVL